MDWDLNTIEREILACGYFASRSFCLKAVNTESAGTDLERYSFTMENLAVDRSIVVTFMPPKGDSRPVLVTVWIRRPSTADAFMLDHFLKQKKSVILNDDVFRFSSYPGDFEQQVRSFLDFLTTLFAKYAEPVLSGKVWPEVYFER